MHNHNNNDNKYGGHKGMMWMMIPCIILLGILFLDGGKLSSSWYLWLIIIGICVGPHIWMMLRGHESHDREGKKKEHLDEHNKNNS